MSEPSTRIDGGSDVVLALMPFASIVKPSLALGCLTAVLRRDGIGVRNLYCNLDFAEAIGVKHYALLSYCYFTDLGEWAFSPAAFPEMQRDDDDFWGIYRTLAPGEALLKARDAANSFIDRCVEQVLALSPKIVGCSLSFSQTCASLALLRRVREAAPEIATVIGGASCEGVMGAELHRSFPWVDYVFSGEADESFPDFCRTLLAGEKVGGAGGWNRSHVLTPHDRRSDLGELGRGVVADISGLPIPCFDDYFETLGKSSIRDRIIPALVLETTRGCWWGAKKPCAFCGLNGQSMKYRSKNPLQAYREITELARRHGVTSIKMADNIIASAHIEQLMPRFEGAGIHFFYEVPATLSREQMRRLSNAGVRQMQPGIEQLNDRSLAAFGKPNRVFHNIRFLKWAREYGIDVIWICLYGFPGENDAWHGEAANLVPLLTHLQAPKGHGAVRFDRFSRYFNERDRYGITLKPRRHYCHIYPLDKEALSRIAYYFERADAEAASPEQKGGLERLIRSLDEWQKLFPFIYARDKREPPLLAMTRNAAGALTIEDTRPAATAPHFTFDGIEAAAYAAADEGKTAHEIARILSRDFPQVSKKGTAYVEDILQGFVASRLMVKLGEIYLALAVAAPFRGYLPEELMPGGYFRREPKKADPGSVTLEQIFGLD